MTGSVHRWTGRETKQLRQALRMTQRLFAEHLGVSDRVVAKWESGGTDYVPRPETQALLDTALARASDEQSGRFHSLTAPGGKRLGRVRDAAADAIRVDSHKFMPVFVGHYLAARLMKRVGLEAPEALLDTGFAPIDHPDADQCSLYVHPCGVALFHIVQPREPETLSELAEWRYRTYATDPPWAAQVLADLLGANGHTDLRPEYVLSAYWLHDCPWDDAQYETALQLMATPSPLVDRSDPNEVRVLGAETETTLLSSGFAHPAVTSIGVHGIAAGFVGWSGVSYHPLALERALTIDELVETEVLAQLIWCYSAHIQRSVETGRDPDVPDQYGWRFLRAAHSRLTSARPLETAQHRLMREAIVNTSGLTDILLGAQAALREDQR
ncbi:helix-turn-helix domain-containing protein [Promicromonospora thailandica]|nr:helix-turn-helix domain-containing protein [Promicromonospora thailandica]BFF20876.1 helix-turn-helix transcriptional regulator [Promicromonospora thailandica]